MVTRSLSVSNSNEKGNDNADTNEYTLNKRFMRSSKNTNVPNINKKFLNKVLINMDHSFDTTWIENLRNNQLEIYVDFETINDIFDDFSSLPEANTRNYLFMIGIGYKLPQGEILKNQSKDQSDDELNNELNNESSNETQKFKYKVFIMKELSRDAEYENLFEFYSFLRELTDDVYGKYDEKNQRTRIPPMFHWSGAEPIFFSKTCENLQMEFSDKPLILNNITLMQAQFNWFDLLSPFKEYPIVIAGVFRFGLKEVVTGLHSLGLVNKTWDLDNPCSGGNHAMIAAFEAYNKSKRTSESIYFNSDMISITNYNENDCYALFSICSIIRNYFI
jgi:hypothetical protein